jgi:alkanesulfonate monooxygenase SsuD/methylene tetrahydromethanopterin reductase-like flavin-dependent oxidoreductase (luciferase family)
VIAFYIGGMGDYYKEMLTRFGYGDECKKVEELYRSKDTRATAWEAVDDDMMDALTIAGDPKRCVDELRRRRSLGLDLPILNLPPGVPWPMVELFLRAMAPSV